MAFCPNCGASVEGRFCAKCGTAVAAAGAGAGPAPGGSPGSESFSQQSYGQASYAAAPPAAAGGLDQNIAGALCYVLGLITGIIFLALAPYNQNKFVRFHAFQSIFFNVAWIAFWILDTILTLMMPWSLQIVLGMLGVLVGLAFLVGWILLLVKAFGNQKFKLPVIGDLAEKQA